MPRQTRVEHGRELVRRHVFPIAPVEELDPRPAEEAPPCASRQASGPSSTPSARARARRIWMSIRATGSGGPRRCARGDGRPLRAGRTPRTATSSPARRSATSISTGREACRRGSRSSERGRPSRPWSRTRRCRSSTARRAHRRRSRGSRRPSGGRSRAPPRPRRRTSRTRASSCGRRRRGPLPHDPPRAPPGDARRGAGPSVPACAAGILEGRGDAIAGLRAPLASRPAQRGRCALMAALCHVDGRQRLAGLPSPPGRVDQPHPLPARQPVRVGARVFFCQPRGRLAHVELRPRPPHPPLEALGHMPEPAGVAGRLVAPRAHGLPLCACVRLGGIVAREGLPAPAIWRASRRPVPVGRPGGGPASGLQGGDGLHLALEGRRPLAWAGAPELPLPGAYRPIHARRHSLPPGYPIAPIVPAGLLP